MPRSPDEYSSSQEPPENSEKKPQRKIFKEIAKVQMDTLGYTNFTQQLSDILQNKGALGELGKLKPHIVGGVTENFYAYADRMQRIPNVEEAVNLLQTGFFGEPAKRTEDGTITVTSFDVAEPSSTTIQTKVPMVGDNQNDKRFVPNVKGTDKLVRKLISDTGFLKEDKTAETIFQLKKGKKISLPHPSITSLIMDIEGPVNSRKDNTRTAYSYNVQTTLSPPLKTKAKESR